MSKLAMTSQQTAFFTQNGYLELEGLNFDCEELFSIAKQAALIQPSGRDLWRREEFIRRLLLRTLAPAIFHLMAKPVRLACDQWMPSIPLDTPCPVKDLFSIQGLVLCAIFSAAKVTIPARRASAVGIPPYPSSPASVLFVKPQIIIDWPILKKMPVELYLAAYALQRNAVYVYNPKDPATHSLKELGYEFGDVLKEAHHPLLTQQS